MYLYWKSDYSSVWEIDITALWFALFPIIDVAFSVNLWILISFRSLTVDVFNSWCMVTMFLTRNQGVLNLSLINTMIHGCARFCCCAILKSFYAKSYTSFLHYSSWRENVLKSKTEKQRKGNYVFYNCSKSNMHFFECKSYVRFHMYNAVNHVHLRMYFSLLLLSIIILVCHFLLLCLC